MAGPLATRAKDLLARVGLRQQARNALWTYRLHRDRLTGAFTMTPVHLPGVEPGPREVVVPLAAITHLATRFVWDRRYRDAFAFDGSWDDRIRRCRPAFDQHPSPGDGDLGAYAHHTVIDLFTRDVPYRETAEYRHLAARIAHGGAPRGCRTIADLDAHFEALLEDHERMRRGHFGRPDPPGAIVAHPVNVFVGRHGEIIHRSQGLHQLRLAELVGLDVVPVRVLAVHIDWLAPCLVDGRDPAEAVTRALASLQGPRAS